MILYMILFLILQYFCILFYYIFVDNFIYLFNMSLYMILLPYLEEILIPIEPHRHKLYNAQAI